MITMNNLTLDKQYDDNLKPLLQPMLLPVDFPLHCQLDCPMRLVLSMDYNYETIDDNNKQANIGWTIWWWFITIVITNAIASWIDGVITCWIGVINGL